MCSITIQNIALFYITLIKLTLCYCSSKKNKQKIEIFLPVTED